MHAGRRTILGGSEKSSFHPSRLTQVVVSMRGRRRAEIARARRRGLLAKFGGRGGLRRRAGMQSLAAPARVRCGRGACPRGVREAWADSPAIAHWPRARGKKCVIAEKKERSHGTVPSRGSDGQRRGARAAPPDSTSPWTRTRGGRTTTFIALPRPCSLRLPSHPQGPPRPPSAVAARKVPPLGSPG